MTIFRYVDLTEDEVDLISAYLHNSQQMVVIPQGSILRPLLIVIYPSCLLEIVKFCNNRIYADDTQLLILILQ